MHKKLLKKVMDDILILPQNTRQENLKNNTSTNTHKHSLSLSLLGPLQIILVDDTAEQLIW